MTTTESRPKVPPGAEPATAQQAPGPTSLTQNATNVLRLWRNCPELFLDLTRRYGDLVRLPLANYLTFLNTSPEGVQRVLVTNNANYIRGDMYERFRIFMGEGLLTADGEDWKRRRTRVNPAFHNSAIRTMTETMVDATDKILDRWYPAAATGTPVNVVGDVMDLALDAMGRILFTADLEPRADRIRPAMEVSIEAMIFKGTPIQQLPLTVPSPYTNRIRRANKVIDEQIRIIVDAHREGTHEKKDLVDLILESAGQPTPSFEEVRDEMKTVFMAGHETTGTGLGWGLYELAANPEVAELAAQEVDAVLGTREPTFEDLALMPYLRRVVDETLRLHPPIWLFPRQAVADDVINGYHVPAGASVFLCPYVSHRDPRWWEDPERFDPDRFTPERSQGRPRFAYLPFGGGQRQCIGNQMALLQMQLTFAMVLQRYRLSLGSAADRELATLVSLRPTNGFPVRFELR